MARSKILIIKPSSLGDIVHTLPAVAAVHTAHPNSEITWLINPEWAPLLRGNPDIDHVHIFPRGQFRGLGAPMRLLLGLSPLAPICATKLGSGSRGPQPEGRTSSSLDLGVTPSSCATV